MKQVRVLKIVVALPSDVQAERDMIPAIVDELNKGIADERGVRLEVYRWETDAYPGFHPEGPQGLIDPVLRIDDCDLLIGIFWKHFGTPTKDVQSGTAYEILTAYESWKKQHRPQIMIYFNEKPHTPRSTEEIEQWKRVLQFKDDFPQQGLWWTYKGKNQFKDLLRNHLTQFIRREIRPPTETTASATPQRLKILFLAANPEDTARLRLDEEFRSIDEALRKAEFRDQFEIVLHWAVRVDDLQECLLRHKPHLVHFSGHGSGAAGIILGDRAGGSHLVSAHALSCVFELLTDNIRWVVLGSGLVGLFTRILVAEFACFLSSSKLSYFRIEQSMI